MTSSLIMPPAKKTEAEKQTAAFQHEQCGTCHFSEPVPQNLQSIGCFGAPPIPMIVGVTQAGQPHIEAMRPILPRATRACALWKRKSAILAS